MKVLTTFPIDDTWVQKIEKLGYEVVFEHEKHSDFEGDYSDVEALVSFRCFDKLKLSQLPSLRFIQLSSTGIDQVPVSFQECGVIISNNHGGYSLAIGEFIVARLLEVYKKLREIDLDQQNNHWNMHMDLHEMPGKKILFVGTGTLAIEGAKRLKAFGVKLFGASQSGHQKECFDEVFTMEELHEKLPFMDVVISTLPATEKTEDYFSDDFFEAMKEGSVFMNVSRGAVVDEEALLRHAEKFRAIILDVYKKEPLPEDDPLRGLENGYLSCHNSWISDKIKERRFQLIYDNLKRFIEGETPKNVVDLRRGY